MQSQSQNGSTPAAANSDATVSVSAPDTLGKQPVPEDSRERQSRIAAEAYRIAEERGFPANSAVDHWYEAQRRLGYSGADLAASSNGSSSERM